MLRRLIVLLLLVATVGVGTAMRGGERTLRPLVTITGAESKITAREFHRITTTQAWTELWLRHVGYEPRNERYDTYYNPAAMPGVDFSQCMVLAILRGDGLNTAAVDVKSITEQGGELLVRFEDRMYQTMDTSNPSTAFGFFILPRTDLPIVLEENVQGLIGRPPIWKRVQRLDR